MNRSLIFLVLLLVIATTTAAAQTSPRCTGPEFRQFDFWIGDWEVRDADGDLLGYNEIRPIAGGCGLLEDWRAAEGGGEGMSINTYDEATGRWTQRWVGADATLWLEGAPTDDGSMVLIGTTPRSTPRGEVVDRITWTPLDDGRVRQAWDISVDGGETWHPTFEGFYSPRTDTDTGI